MKHNIFKRTLAAGLAVLYVAAYAPTFGNTGLFDTAITASAEGEEKTWPYKNIKATPHNPRLTPLHAICLPAFRHITQILLAGRQPACVEFRQSDENLDFASDAQGSCGVALNNNICIRSPNTSYSKTV